MPIISVIVPLYKVEKYIHRCVNSILNQTFSDFELILVDDGSPDNCGEICDKYAQKDSRVKVIHQENNGISAARNAGISYAKKSDSQWISFVDSDDWIHPCFLEHLFQAATTYQVSVSCCDFQRISEGASPTPVPDLMIELTKTEDVYCTGNGVYAYPWRFLYSKKLFEDIVFPTGKIYEDIATTPKLIFQVTHVAEVKQKLYYYFYRENSLAHSTWSLQQLDIIDAYEENLRFFKGYSEKKLHKCVAFSYLMALHTQVTKVCASDLDKREKRHYSIWLKWKLRVALLRYARKADIHIGTDGWLFAAAYPRLMELYWGVCGQLNKLKK